MESFSFFTALRTQTFHTSSFIIGFKQVFDLNFTMCKWHESIFTWPDITIQKRNWNGCFTKATYLCTLLWAVVLLHINASLLDNTYRRINDKSLTKESLSATEKDNHFCNDIVRPLLDTKMSSFQVFLKIIYVKNVLNKFANLVYELLMFKTSVCERSNLWISNSSNKSEKINDKHKFSFKNDVIKTRCSRLTSSLFLFFYPLSIFPYLFL